MDRYLLKFSTASTSNESTKHKSFNDKHSERVSSNTDPENEENNNSIKATPVDTSIGNSDSDSTVEVDVPVKRRMVYKQKFREKWLQTFDWLQERNNNKICKVCNVVINGAGFHLKRHGTSITHKKKYETASKTPSAVSYFSENNDKVKQFRLIQAAELKMSAYLCEQNLPLRLMDSLPAVCANMFPDSQIASGLKIKRKKATQLVSTLAEVASNELISKLRTTDFSLIVDETTDISTHKSLAIVVRFWNSHEGKVKDRFLNLLEVESASAQSLFNLIKHILDKNKIPYRRMIGFAADNASVMMGHMTGVQARLKELNPHIVVIGCTSHRLHLCASQAAKKLPNSVENLARDIYNYFAHSSKRTMEFKEHQIFANEKPTKILYPSQTRWLSLRMVVERILNHWNSLTLFFNGEALSANSSSTAKALMNALQNPIFKVYFSFLSYVLELITKINVEFQAENPKLPHLLERITALYKTLLKSFIKKDVINSHLDNLSKINVACPHNYKNLEEIYFGAKADLLLNDEQNFDINDLNTFRVKVLDFYIELCKEITKRFNFDDIYLKYASLFTPGTALAGDVLSIATFKKLFPNLDADVESVNSEWQLLSELANFKNYKNADLTEFWSVVDKERNSLNQPMFPSLMKVVRYVLTFPHSSAVCERMFSWLALIKTKQRNRLLVRTCDNILRVKDKLRNGGYDYENLGKDQISETDTDINIDICDIFDYE